MGLTTEAPTERASCKGRRKDQEEKEDQEISMTVPQFLSGQCALCSTISKQMLHISE